MIQNRWDPLSPGNEQAFYWGSAAADQDGARYMGVKVRVDAMIAALLRAGALEFVDAVRALDRVLLSGAYVIPLYQSPEQWIARWSQINHPSRTALSGFLPETWWRQGSVVSNQ
jgi:peptide/nickel transport system substrate-binding protein